MRIDPQPQSNGGNFVVLFWATIVILAMLTFYGYFHLARLAQQQSSQRPPVEVKKDPQMVWQEIIEDFQQLLPETFVQMEQRFADADQDFADFSGKRIDQAFAPVYARIPQFLDFHYSVKGEYTELLAGLSGEMGSHLQRILFAEAGFDQEMEQAVAAIVVHSENLLGDALLEIQANLGAQLQLDDAQLGQLAGVLKLSLDDSKKRFGGSDVLFKGAGAVVGVSVAKLMGKKLVATLTAKIAAKGTLKASGFGAGAAAGGAAGLLCGPAAWICSPVAGVTAGVAFWLLTDKVVIELDEYFNREEFSAQIRASLDQQRKAIAGRLQQDYRGYLRAIIKAKKIHMQNISTRDLIETGNPD